MKLNSDLSIQNAEQLHSALEAEYEKGDELSLDASDVSRIDTTIFQILAALKIKLKSENTDLTINEPSAEFVGSAELLGLAAFFELPRAQIV